MPNKTVVATLLSRPLTHQPRLQSRVPHLSVSKMKILHIIVLLLFTAAASVLFAESPADVVAAAAKGDLDAMFELGSVAIEDGQYPEARSWFEKASAKDHAPSKAALGFMYFNGFACEKDLTKARELYEQSAKAGSHDGLNNLAHLYRYGLAGLKQDLVKSVELLEESAKKGNEYAVNTLSSMYRSNELGAPDLAKTMKWLKFGAERDNPGCLSDLGYAYEHGIGVEKNTANAIAYYKKAISSGSVSAQSNLGYLYLMGSGVVRDYDIALKLFAESASRGHVGGMINFAVMKYNGLGCERNPDEAFELLKKANDQGNLQAGQMLNEWKAKEQGVQEK